MKSSDFDIIYSEGEIFDVVSEIQNLISDYFLGKNLNKVLECECGECGVSVSNKNYLIMGLKGDLGAGKTTLTKNLLKNYGVEKSVASPTFVLRRDYEIDFDLGENIFLKKIIHIDAYRLEKKEDIEKVLLESELESFDDFDNQKVLIIVEWPELTNLNFDLFFEILHMEGGARNIKRI